MDDIKLMQYVDGELSDEEELSIKNLINNDVKLQKKIKILELTSRSNLQNSLGKLNSEFNSEVKEKLSSIENEKKYNFGNIFNSIFNFSFILMF